MCCEADWKREVVPDHKFDFINVREFHRTDVFTRLKYIWRYILLLKSFVVYGLDIYTASTLILSSHWTNAIQNSCGTSCPVEVRFDIAKWIFVGCIIFSFLLLGYETYKAKKVIESRDISYAFTNLLANDYYSFKNYDNFCLFSHIDSSTKKKDDFAFFIFFTFKEWKRLLLADGPRQSVNGILLYTFAWANGFQTSNIPAYWNGSISTAMLLFAMIATVLIFAGSLILLIAAAILYVPLLCYIQGNLKEYVCHKVDKRISELIKRKQRDRMRKAAALEKKLAKEGIKNSKGDVMMGNVLQPTLPDVKLDDEDLVSHRGGGGRKGVEKVGGGSDDGLYPGNPPPGSYEYDAYGGYPPSSDYRSPPGGFYQHDDVGSSTALTASAAPMGLSYPPPAASPIPPQSLPSYSTSNLHQPYPSSNQAPSYTSRSNTNLSSTTYTSNQSYNNNSPPSSYHNHQTQNGYAPSPISSIPSNQRHMPSRLSIPQQQRHYGEAVNSPSAYSGSQASYDYDYDRDYAGSRRGDRTSGLAYDDPLQSSTTTAPPSYRGGENGGNGGNYSAGAANGNGRGYAWDR